MCLTIPIPSIKMSDLTLQKDVARTSAKKNL
jgi:hypothetical protein